MRRLPKLFIKPTVFLEFCETEDRQTEDRHLVLIDDALYYILDDGCVELYEGLPESVWCICPLQLATHLYDKTAQLFLTVDPDSGDVFYEDGTPYTEPVDTLQPLMPFSDSSAYFEWTTSRYVYLDDGRFYYGNGRFYYGNDSPPIDNDDFTFVDHGYSNYTFSDQSELDESDRARINYQSDKDLLSELTENPCSPFSLDMAAAEYEFDDDTFLEGRAFDFDDYESDEFTQPDVSGAAEDFS